jgi:hypothetical protein
MTDQTNSDAGDEPPMRPLGAATKQSVCLAIISIRAMINIGMSPGENSWRRASWGAERGIDWEAARWGFQTRGVR